MGDLRGRLIAFDLDGTLIDSRRDLADAANALIVELGGRPLPEDAIGRMVGEGASVLVERALRASGLLPERTAVAEDEEAVPAVSRALERFLVLYDERLLNHTRAYPGIPEALAAARRHGRVAVLTNKPQRATERILDGLGIRSLLDEVIGGDTSWPRKPDPSSLRHLMARAGADSSSTLLVGDSAIDHETARRAGVRCCLAAYGFGYETFPRERLTGTEIVVGNGRELSEVVNRFAAETAVRRTAG